MFKHTFGSQIRSLPRGNGLQHDLIGACSLHSAPASAAALTELQFWDTEIVLPLIASYQVAFLSLTSGRAFPSLRTFTQVPLLRA